MTDHLSGDVSLSVATVAEVRDYLDALEALATKEPDLARGGEFCWHDTLWHELPDDLWARFTHTVGSLHAIWLGDGSYLHAFHRRWPSGLAAAVVPARPGARAGDHRVLLGHQGADDSLRGVDVGLVSARNRAAKLAQTYLSLAEPGRIEFLRTLAGFDSDPDAVASVVNDTNFSGSAALSAVDGFYTGKDVYFTSGPLNGQRGRVTGYTGATRTFTFAANTFTAAPAVGNTFQKICYLMDERMFVTDLQPRHPPFAHVRMLAIADVDAAPTAQRAFGAVIEPLQPVQIVQIPLDRGLLAVDLERIQRLVAAGIARALE